MTTQSAVEDPSEVARPAEAMTHRQVLEALSGLLLGMFVTILSSTVVSTALPRIVSELGGSQSAFTWVVTASLLSMTVSTPIWGKFADLFSRKLLVQVALIVFVVGSALAGLSQSTGPLIAFRVLQGLGAGGLTALSQVILADIISPRERGRYMGFLGAVMAVGTVAGPFLGGVLTDSSLGWRSTFYVGVPFAVVALVVLQKTLHLPRVRRKVSIDYLGALLLSAGVADLMIWVTLAGNQFDWASRTTAVMVGGGVVLLILAVVVEARAKEPILPLWLFRNRTFVFAIIASVAVGIAMFGTSVFLSQYMQIARGKSPTETGLISIPMAIGSLLSATVVGQIITRTGRWKRWMVLGGLLLIAGAGLMGTIDYQTSFIRIGAFLLLLGLGVGMCMQNLVLAVQNTISIKEMGAASSAVAFFRSMGGAVGVSVLGAVLASQVASSISDGLARLGIKAPTGSDTVPEVSKLPPPVRTVVEAAYGQGVADIFLVATPVAVVALLAILCIKEIPLGTKTGIEQQLEMAKAEVQSPAEDVAVEPVVGNGRPRPTKLTPDENPTVALVGAAPNGHRVQSGAHRLERAVEAALPAIEGASAAPLGYGGGGPGAPSGRRIGGTVRRPDGSPVGSAALTLINLGGHQVGRTSTDRDGAYALTADADGAYVLITSAASYQPQAATVVISDEPVTVDVVLTGVSGLVGEVRAAATHLPVAGAVAVLADSRGEVIASQASSADGTYRFDDVVASTYTLAVRAQGFQPVALSVAVAGTGETRQDVELVAKATVRGTTRTRDGEPVPDARVTLLDLEGNVVRMSYTDHEGGYAFADLDAGDYTVVATGYPAVARGLSLSGGEVTAHDVELSHPDM
ncbi:MFS transporter [Actinopolymorpha alba]|uniref:MFS transporter n=1 Tax=Actinopolymorpha alba TaxID=533267 RepID=UPI00039E088F|nr:MFS transporter [Actinopolymorpha alba]